MHLIIMVADKIHDINQKIIIFEFFVNIYTHHYTLKKSTLGDEPKKEHIPKIRGCTELHNISRDLAKIG